MPENFFQKIIIVISFLGPAFFLNPNAVLASASNPADFAITTDYYSSTSGIPNWLKEAPDCPAACAVDGSCANSANDTNCDLPNCDGGNDWTKYNIQSCKKISYDPDTDRLDCTAVYTQDQVVYSIGDKCYAGEYGLRSSSCFNEPSPTIYKTCCSNTTPSYVISDSRAGTSNSCSPFDVDGRDPSEGRCPGGSREEFCGFGNHAACGQPACGTLPTDVWYCDGASIWHKKSDESNKFKVCDCSSSGTAVDGTFTADCVGNACRTKTNDANDAECYTDTCTYGSWDSWSSGSCCENGLRGETRTRSVTSGTNCQSTSETRCTKADSSCNNSGNTKTYVNPNPANKGNTVTVTATGTTSCSTGINFQVGGGLSGCSDSGYSCSGNPMGDGNPCWWRRTCTATTAGNSFTASFNASGSGCYSSQNYTINNPTVTLSGKVTNASTGVGLSGVVINKDWTEASPAPECYIGTKTTSSDGTFSFPNVAYEKSFCMRGPKNGIFGYAWKSGSYECQTAGRDMGTFDCDPQAPVVIVTDAPTDDAYNFSYTLIPKPNTPTVENKSKLANGCIPSGYTGSDISISWTNNDYPVTWVDISTTSDFTSDVYHVEITGGKTSTTAPLGFNRFDDKSGKALTLNPSQAYYVQTFNGSLNHSDKVPFSLPFCPCPGGGVTGAPTGIAACGEIGTGGKADPNTLGSCPTGSAWEVNPGTFSPVTNKGDYDSWCSKNTGRNYCFKCESEIRPWIQTTGDVHSNTAIRATGGPHGN